MALKEEIPNKALNGEELKEIACQEFRRMLDTDYAFLTTVAYRRVGMTLTATFHLGFPHPIHELKSRVHKDDKKVVEGPAPLNPVPSEGTVVALEREVKLDNPNVDRIHHDMPIKMQRAVPPKPIVHENSLPGEAAVFDTNQPGIENIELRYDKTDAPAPAPPVDRDVSQAAADQMGVPVSSGLGYKKKG